MIEQKIQKKILDELARRRVWATKIITANRNGVPDILACHRGRFYAIEVKQPGQKASPIQNVQIERIRAAGGTAFVACSWEQVEAEINFD
jgi:Holliday junction resolvase